MSQVLVISAPALSKLQTAIIEATHGLTGLDGVRVHPGTINDRTLRQAAMCAIMTASGETILPGDTQIDIKAPSQENFGPFRIQRG